MYNVHVHVLTYNYMHTYMYISMYVHYTWSKSVYYSYPSFIEPNNPTLCMYNLLCYLCVYTYMYTCAYWNICSHCTHHTYMYMYIYMYVYYTKSVYYSYSWIGFVEPNNATCIITCTYVTCAYWNICSHCSEVQIWCVYNTCTYGSFTLVPRIRARNTNTCFYKFGQTLPVLGWYIHVPPPPVVVRTCTCTLALKYMYYIII